MIDNLSNFIHCIYGVLYIKNGNICHIKENTNIHSSVRICAVDELTSAVATHPPCNLEYNLWVADIANFCSGKYY